MIRAFSCIIVSLLIVGCGSDVAGGVSIADAHTECDLLSIIADGRPISEGLFDALVIQAEAARDDGILQSAYITEKVVRCNEVQVTIASRDQCLVCVTSIAAAVWQ